MSGPAARFDPEAFADRWLDRVRGNRPVSDLVRAAYAEGVAAEAARRSAVVGQRDELLAINSRFRQALIAAVQRRRFEFNLQDSARVNEIAREIAAEART